MGDAPDSYGTTLASNGPTHIIVPGGFSLGLLIDSELDGQASANADGDDGDGTDDDDGVNFAAPTMLTCNNTSVDVELVNTAGVNGSLLDAWIDFDGNGVFDEPTDRIATNAVLAIGINTINYFVPCNGTIGTTYARFRLSSTGGLGATGIAIDGEVEDYLVFMGNPVDMGDAPDSYGTLFASGGPTHVIVPNGFSLGLEIDHELDGQPTVNANGDDLNGFPDDEDGVCFAVPTLVACESNSADVGLVNTAGVASAFLDAWVDFDGNGVFNATDRIADSVVLSGGVNTINFTIPCTLSEGWAYARFRLSSTGGLGPTGLALDGEVEENLTLTRHRRYYFY